MIQAHINFSGTVQGVGFRYTTLGYARELGLRGWVRNLSSGGVEAMVQGERSEVEKLCQKLKEHFDGYIRDVTVSWTEPEENLDGFVIK